MFRAVLLASTALLVFPAAAFAQAALPPIELEEISVTANLTPTPAREVGSAVTVVTREELEQRQIRFVSDALRSVPGVAVNRSGTFGGLTQLRIRGSEGNQTLVFIDGIEVNDPVGGNEFDFAHLLTQDIERIEVLRGPQSALFGSDAIGGVVNIVTRRGEGPPKAAGFIEGGNRGTVSGAASLAGSTDRVDYLASAGGFRTDGFSSASEFRGNDERDGYRNGTAFAKLGVQAADNLRLDLVGRGTDYRVETDNSFSGIPIDADSEVNGRQFYGRAQAKLDLLDGHWQHKLGASHANNSFDDQTENAPFLPGVFSFSSFEGRKTKVDYQSSFFFSADALPEIDHTFTFAAEHERDEAESTFLATDREIEQDSLVAQYQAGLWDALFVTGSVRQDFNDLFGDHTTYRLTGAYLVENTGTKIRASWGTGIKNPTIFELFGSTPTFQGNPDLDPERGEGWDAGVDQTLLDGRLVLEATYFDQRIEDLIQGAGPTAFNLAGTSEIRGIELGATATLFEGLAVRTSYTWLEAEDPNGDELLRRPSHLASLDVSYTFLENRAQIGFGLVYNGEQEDLSFETFPATRVTLDPFLLVNARASYRLTDQAEVYARAENLLDEEYEEVFGLGGSGRTGVLGMRVNF